MRVTEERFRELVRRAIDDLPPRFREKLENVEIIVEDRPTAEQQGRFRGMLLGLYHGIPQPRRSTFIPFIPPDMIFLFKKNIESICDDETALERQIRATLLHEIGHHFGMSEEDLAGL
ncbi:MAG TPA: metallopeptidase family protein [Acidobacteriota bacterium]|jgi:predicted Zn-dependent protease with MMP-like domain